jgi:XTP/dITP diphosphohydrolase
MKIVLATRNPDKIREIEAIMGGIDVSLLRADAFDGIPDVIEDGNTLEENALKKARAIRDFTGLCALSDDTGLEVDVLDGAPGVFSARYAGVDGGYEANNRKLLEDLSGVPQEKRTARFRCVMAFALAEEIADRLHDSTAAAHTDVPDALVTEGILEGRITTEKRGESGFGYDPIFEVPTLGQTLSEIGLEEKNRISHRYRALVEMRELLLRLNLVDGT